MKIIWTKGYKINQTLTCADDGGFGVSPEAVLKDPGKLTIPIGNVGRDTAAQLLNNLRGSVKINNLRNKNSLPVPVS